MKRLVATFTLYGTLLACLSAGTIKHSGGSGPEQLKAAAFRVLEAKCNVCHEKKNPSRVFTRENMNPFAKKIHKQVFVFKRMPKGKNIRLTEEEYRTLKNWLRSQNIH